MDKNTNKAVARAIQAIAVKFGDEYRTNIYGRAQVSPESFVVTNGNVMLRVNASPESFRLLTKGVDYADFSNHTSRYPDADCVWPRGKPQWEARVTVPDWAPMITKPGKLGVRLVGAEKHPNTRFPNHVYGIDAAYLALLPSSFVRLAYFDAMSPFLFSENGAVDDKPLWEMLVMPMAVESDAAVLRHTVLGADYYADATDSEAA